MRSLDFETMHVQQHFPSLIEPINKLNLVFPRLPHYVIGCIAIIVGDLYYGVLLCSFFPYSLRPSSVIQIKITVFGVGH